jgi:uncharacterized protein (UPF0335 family)
MFQKAEADDTGVNGAELRRFIERAEKLAAEKREIAEQEEELFAHADWQGYDTKAIRQIIAIRRRRPDEIAEEQAVLDIYLAALGMARGQK